MVSWDAGLGGGLGCVLVVGEGGKEGNEEDGGTLEV